jgi:hypothetical protein
MPGSLLVKEYRGDTHVVKVLDSGFDYDGRLYRSFSAIAHEITGTKWNGFLFFGRATRIEYRTCSKSARSSFSGATDGRPVFAYNVSDRAARLFNG